jgi:hypothetical protein
MAKKYGVAAADDARADSNWKPTNTDLSDAIWNAEAIDTVQIVLWNP